MKTWSLSLLTLLSGCLISLPAFGGVPATTSDPSAPTRNFAAQGVIQQLPADHQTVVIKHGAIASYMEAMTMPFKVKDSALLNGLAAGDEVTFQLHVTDDESWVDHIRKIGTAPVTVATSPAVAPIDPLPPGSFMNYPLTNELGKTVTLQDFHGQALAITFFYTRCPLPDFCPRLSKNFSEATAKLRALPGAPANWHFLSISFDTAFDTPDMLKSYGELYGYHPNEWSFLTGSPAEIKELARLSGVNYTVDGGGFNHNFRTLIVDPAGHLQMTFPMGGDLSADIVTQILRAAAATNEPAISASTH